jgi:hypothetical protein
MKNIETSNSLDHIKNIQSEFEKLIDHLRKDITTIKEPRAKALFETSAEVLRGLSKAFSDYTEKNEKAWREN